MRFFVVTVRAGTWVGLIYSVKNALYLSVRVLVREDGDDEIAIFERGFEFLSRDVTAFDVADRSLGDNCVADDTSGDVAFELDPGDRIGIPNRDRRVCTCAKTADVQFVLTSQVVSVDRCGDLPSRGGRDTVDGVSSAEYVRAVCPAALPVAKRPPTAATPAAPSTYRR